MKARTRDLRDAPLLELPYRPRAVDVERRSDGSVILRSPYPPASAPRSIAHLFLEQSAREPDRLFIQERDGDGRWHGLSYAQMCDRARGFGNWLLEHEVAGTNGLMVLSGNSIDHASVMLGCYLAGVPITTLSQAYSLGSTDFQKLRHCFAKIRPRAIFVQSGDSFEKALDVVRALDPAVLLISADGANGTLRLADLEATQPTTALEVATDRLGHATIAKYLFTSGSTGMPKAVPQTHGMMAATVAARHGLFIDPEERCPPKAVEWMPWSHISAGNIGFNHNIWAGGTLYLDEGRPMPGLFAATWRNLLDVGPETFGSAPIAFEMLAAELKADPNSARPLLSGLRWLAYGGAALSQDVADRVQQLAIELTGHAIPIITTYGATEVQAITSVYWPTTRVGMIGLPLPGVEIKLAPAGDKLEVRARGACVMSGYLDEPKHNAEAFDDEGYFCLGDAATWVDANDPSQGIVFDGRLSEDFKLTSGTWVSVGPLRAGLLEMAAPHVSEVVIAGQDRPFVAAFAWLSKEAAADRAVTEGDLQRRISAFNASQGGSSRRIARMIILDEPLSHAAGEITEKGYVNQRAVLARRRTQLDRLYSAEPEADVIILE